MKTLFGRGLDKQARDEFERLRLKSTATKETVVATPSSTPVAPSSRTLNLTSIQESVYTDTQIAHATEDILFAEPNTIETFQFVFEPNRIYSFSGYFAATTLWNYRPAVSFVSQGIEWCKGLKRSYFATSDGEIEVASEYSRFRFDFLTDKMFFDKKSSIGSISHSYINEIEGSLYTGEAEGTIDMLFEPSTSFELLEGHFSILMDSSYILFNKGPEKGE